MRKGQKGHTHDTKEKIRPNNARNGLSNTRAYAKWKSMHKRCYDPTASGYNNYGGRGIIVCPEWFDFDVFHKWLIEQGLNENAARGEQTIERIDVNGPYSPENCKLATMKEQANNTRRSYANRFIDVGGVTFSIAEAAKVFDIDPTIIVSRQKKGKVGKELVAPTYWWVQGGKGLMPFMPTDYVY